MKKWILISLMLASFGLTAQDAKTKEATSAVAPTANATAPAETVKPEKPVENKDAKKVADLEKSVAEMKKALEEQAKKSEAQNAKIADLEKKMTVKPVKKIEKKPVTKKAGVVFKPYGFVELYGWENDVLFTGNDLPLFVKNEDKKNFGMTPKGTRLGTKILFPSIKSVDLMGVVEVDFVANNMYSGAAESRPGIRMRHGYMKLSKTLGDTTIGFLAGQTWSIATPLIFPSLIDPSGGWAIGNVWQRQPLIKVCAKQKMGDFSLIFQGGIARAMTGASSHKNSFIETNIDAGDAANTPQMQGQLGIKGKVSGIGIFAAVGGAFGKEDYSKGVNYNSKKDENGKSIMIEGDKVDVYLLNAGAKISHKYAGISGKYFMGKNLDLFGVFGGALLFDDKGKVSDGRKAHGFWAQLSINPIPGVININAGLGQELIDDAGTYVNKKDFLATGMNYKSNKGMWITAYYTIAKHIKIGFQYLNIKTEGKESATENTKKERSGNSIMYDFKYIF